ncbi:MAG TPA: PAS domain S-box protein [Candidatus Limnocylindria bacterium]|nr:PAS domain S-box protein [Candidatus Limnocylindria bacterium]
MALRNRRVLIIEDNAMDSSLLAKMLRQGYGEFEVVRAESMADAEGQLAGEHFHTIISDLTLPDSQGLATFTRLHDAAGHSPIIVISGTDDEELALAAVREGAQDYLVKGRFDAAGLRRAIKYAIERHQIEQALQDSEQHYRHLLESITDYTYAVKLRDGVAVETKHSPTCVSVTGYTAEQYQEDPELWLRMVHPDDQAAVVEQAKRVSSGETPVALDHRLRHKNGDLRWVRNTVVPRRDEGGSAIAYDGLIRDITARKTAEEKLVKSEAFYHSLVESLPQHIIRKDLNERFTFANQKFCQLLGKPLDQIVGKTDFDFYQPDLARKYQTDDRHVMKSGRTFEAVEVNQAPGGEQRYVNVIKSPIHDLEGHVIGIQGIFWDITERMRADEDLRRTHAELRKSHAEVKAAQLQLIQAAKMESIGTLAAGVAHEVKNPLATLAMGLSYLEKSVNSTDENVRMVLSEMRAAIGRADKITRELLDFSAARQLDVQSEDLNRLLEQTLVLIRHQLNKQQIELITDFAPALPHVSIEKNQIQQVLVNLLMNSIHAMSSGGKLTVRTSKKRLTRSLHEEGSRSSTQFFLGDSVVTVEIEDTGPGIPQENLAKIFDPFFTTKPTGVGTGLGLPVSKKIVELHGGAIEIINRVEGGVRVTVMLRADKTL